MINDKWAIIGSAPTLKQKDIDYIRDKLNVIVINDNYLRCPWADILYWCDRKWFNWHKDKREFRNFMGVKATLSNCEADWNFGRGVETGLNDHPEVLNTGKNSAHQCVNLAVHLAATEIYLMGIDMKKTGNKTHWHDNHIIKTNPEVYDKMLPLWETIIPDLGQTKVINCSLTSRIECFEKKDIRECI